MNVISHELNNAFFCQTNLQNWIFKNEISIFFLYIWSTRKKLCWVMGNATVWGFLSLNFLPLVEIDFIITLITCCPSNKIPHDWCVFQEYTYSAYWKVLQQASVTAQEKYRSSVTHRGMGFARRLGTSDEAKEAVTIQKPWAVWWSVNLLQNLIIKGAQKHHQ